MQKMGPFSSLSNVDEFMKEQANILQEPDQENTLQNENHQLNNMWPENMTSPPTGSFQHPLVPLTILNSSSSQFAQHPYARKKAGRKPNPATPALRKEQNRAAQRAFRERKERHIESLENTIHDLRNQLKELNNVKKDLEISQIENWYLKGIVLTLQLVCMQYHVNIPTHAPYLSDQDLYEMTALDPTALEAYINAEAKNDASIKSFLVKSQKKPETKQNTTSSVVSQCEPDWVTKIDESEIDKLNSEEPIPHLQEEALPDPLTSNLDDIHYLQLKLSVKSYIDRKANMDDLAASRLRPSILQMAVPHDPRINLIPTQHMRDRMIIFKDQLDYDHCFGLIINGAEFSGGDITNSNNWQLPAEFYRQYWFLALNYNLEKMDISKTMIINPEPRPDCPYIGSQIQQQYGMPSQVPPTTFGNYDLSNVISPGSRVWNEKAVNAILQNIPDFYPMYRNPASLVEEEEAPKYDLGLFSVL